MINCYGADCSGWKLIHPQATIDMIGVLPNLVDRTSALYLREQISANYDCGAWSGEERWSRAKTWLRSVRYPDEVFRLIASYRHDATGETLELYDSAFCAVVAKDGKSFVVTRLD